MVQLVHSKEEANCITHSGTMHADEVFATAFLDLYLGDVRVFRTSSISLNEVEEGVLVYDIGRGEYDHHQIDAVKRDNSITYSSVGLLWKKFGKDFLEKQKFENVEEMFLGIDKDLVEEIDGDDNGVFPKVICPYKVKTLPNIIKIFNPSYDSNETEDSQFLKAVSLAKMIWEEEILYIRGKVVADHKIKDLLSKKDPNQKYLLLDQYLPYEDSILGNEEANHLLFVAYPSNRGGYSIKTIPKSAEDKTARMEFPVEWAGLENQDLEEVSGIEGLRFCHTGRFLVSCNSLQSVYQVLDKLCQ